MTESSASVLSQRVLIFGGTFDPPHHAHVELPKIAARELGCGRIIYVPAAVNPLKARTDAPPPTPATHRLAMLRLALRGMPNVEISTIEVDRPPPSYTIDTLKSLVGPAAADRPAAFLLIGADQALDFHRWKDWQGILELATPAVMLRPPWTRERFAAALRDRYDQREADRWLGWTLQTLPMLDVTATDIRSRLAGGRSVSGLLDPRVEAFIRDHELYGTGRAAP
jgi:nicotinate-nucleotide adenylyltransferase